MKMMHKHIRYSPCSVPLCVEDFPVQERNPAGRPPVRDLEGNREAGGSSFSKAGVLVPRKAGAS
jgi:hypothetical protein